VMNILAICMKQFREKNVSGPIKRLE